MTPGAAAAPATRPQETPATRSAAASSGAVPDAAHLDESSTKFKMGKCFAALREWPRMHSKLETIPARARTLPVTLALAEAYKRTGYDRAQLGVLQGVPADQPGSRWRRRRRGAPAPRPPSRPKTKPPARTRSPSNALRRLTRERVALASGDAATAAPAHAALAETFPGTRASSLARARAAAAAAAAPPPAERAAARVLDAPRRRGRDEFAENLRVAARTRASAR